MWNTPSVARLNKIPRLYETENQPTKDKLITCIFSSVAVIGTSLSMTAMTYSSVLPYSTRICSMRSGVISRSLS